jgi:hypothetical protein
MLSKESLHWLIRSTLEEYGLYSNEAFELIYGTIIQESLRGKYRRQMVNNWKYDVHAAGICQIEYNTFNWLKKVFMNRFPEIAKVQFVDLIYDDKMSILFCRLRYLVVKEPIPKDLEGQANYWKVYYNSAKGKGKPEEYIKNYLKYS